MTQSSSRRLVMLGQVMSFSPDGRVVVRLQWVRDAAYVVTVETSVFVDELRRAFPDEAAARAYARGVCLGLRAGWSLDRLGEIGSVAA